MTVTPERPRREPHLGLTHSGPRFLHPPTLRLKSASALAVAFGVSKPITFGKSIERRFNLATPYTGSAANTNSQLVAITSARLWMNKTLITNLAGFGSIAI